VLAGWGVLVLAATGVLVLAALGVLVGECVVSFGVDAGAAIAVVMAVRAGRVAAATD
jgi:hypothetical protein